MNSIGGTSSGDIGKIQGFSFTDSNLEAMAKKKEDSFSAFFDAAVGLLDETSRYEHEANQIQLDYITGKTDDLLAVSAAEQKAYTSLSFTVQITNKIIDTYKQIMALQL